MLWYSFFSVLASPVFYMGQTKINLKYELQANTNNVMNIKIVESSQPLRTEMYPGTVFYRDVYTCSLGLQHLK